MDNRDIERIGAPPAAAAWWGICRYNGVQEEPQTHADEDGVRTDKWPVSTLSLARVREMFGAGDYRVTWFRKDADERPKGCGRGNRFGFDEIERESAPPVAAPGSFAEYQAILEAAERKAEARAEAMFARFERMMGAAGPHVAAAAGAPSSGPSREVVTLREELATMRAELERDREIRRLEEKHREALAAKDKEIAELKEEDKDDEPLFSPDSPLVQTVAYGAMNAVAKDPEIVGKILGKALENPAVQAFVARMMGGGGAPAIAPPGPVPVAANPAPHVNGAASSARVHDVPPG